MEVDKNSSNTVPTSSRKMSKVTKPRFNAPPGPRFPPPRVDTSSTIYKKTAAKYVRFMVAMPILLVTSYYLFDRLALGHEKKELRPARPVEELGVGGKE
ncbi:hypothetical protein GGS20DRAFT_559590 [Poronia punctata]|nr:hypothetical protein GGS20DRAFT_559590 [Poronia punctata]